MRLLRDEWAGETPKGAKRQGAHRTPRGKRTPVTEINHFQGIIVYQYRFTNLTS
ncbi:hypothetical protein IHV10_21155 [Fictibacillus sp. 5RED26]|uniref:hypothetical protein n=1 Tax=Fictibacillus sp. 5RED26 TaxID=2745876 RepID=UPI0018CDF127|nr:hypothetical protein [Fictibacillus sp. 5RED26]MBH0158900.1 hypothetical protein [Fictibacillus sp. 5RED26]